MNVLQRSARRLGLAQNTFNELVLRLSEPHRAYHTTAHIADLLELLERHRNLASDPQAVEWAIWLHDIIYDPKSRTNEEDSAAFARSLLVEDAELSATVADLIMATKTHRGETDDARLLLDLDLSILCASPDRFAWFEKAIRKEFDCYTDEEFRVGRTSALNSFLQRDRIYHTTPFLEMEGIARENLRWAIAELNAPTPSAPKV